MVHVAYYKTWVEVDAAALRHNVRVIQKLVGKDVAIMAVIKSNAYGHGITEVVRTLSRRYIPSAVRSLWFGVDSIEEALILKREEIRNPILILGRVPMARLGDVLKNTFRVALYDKDVLQELARLAKRLHTKALVHMKIETGTNRQGIVQKDLPACIRLLKRYKNFVDGEGIYTHFVDAENSQSRFYKEQLQNFEQALALLEKGGIMPRFRHVASSAAMFLYPETRFNLVRPGISLYGLYPSDDVKHRVSDSVKLQPALVWKTRVAEVKEVPRGGTVSYGRTFRATKPMKIAVLPVGYWDGFDRRFSNKGEVLIKGERARVLGVVCMNMVMIDVTGIRGVRAEDEVVLVGRQGKEEITADELAERLGTINYEVVTRINPTINRIVLKRRG